MTLASGAKRTLFVLLIVGSILSVFFAGESSSGKSRTAAGLGGDSGFDADLWVEHLDELVDAIVRALRC